jgi:hypothetical protein
VKIPLTGPALDEIQVPQPCQLVKGVLRFEEVEQLVVLIARAPWPPGQPSTSRHAPFSPSRLEPFVPWPPSPAPHALRAHVFAPPPSSPCPPPVALSPSFLRPPSAVALLAVGVAFQPPSLPSHLLAFVALLPSSCAVPPSFASPLPASSPQLPSDVPLPQPSQHPSVPFPPL